MNPSEKYRTIVDLAPSGVILIDPATHTIVDINQTAAGMFGESKTKIIGSICHKHICPAEAGRCPVTDLGMTVDKAERVLLKKDGTSIPILKTVAGINLDGSNLLLESFLDISDMKKLQQELLDSEKKCQKTLEEMATHDFLTGLPNRVLLLDRFNIAVAMARRNKTRLAVISLDLDKFKSINDLLGHCAGDQVLKDVSKRLVEIIRASDTLARVGGDEFILLMTDINSASDARTIARKMLDSFAEPLFSEGHTLHLSTSIGIAVYTEDGEDIDILTKKSDAAMYYAKGHGRNQLKFWSDGNVLMGGDHRSAST